ncbi:hypothetical protein Ancab_021072 [Ancistrocladus abbreviatus]
MRPAAASKRLQMTTINGPRPSPLKLNHSSQLIHKPSHPAPLVADHHLRHGRRKTGGPVIIYTRSPTVIHAQPRDFMALVQKLTGLSSHRMASDNQQQLDNCHHNLVFSGLGSGGINHAGDHDNGHRSSFLDSFNSSSTRIDDIPLYTPTGIDLLLSATMDLPVSRQ